MKHQRLVQTTAVAAFAPVGAAALAFNSRSELNGGANRDRTDDLKLAKLALSQLSYGPVVLLRSWWAWEDLNFRPHAYQARALTN